MIKFKSNKKAMFLKYFGVHIEPVYDIETDTMLWLVDETDYCSFCNSFADSWLLVNY